MKTAIIIANHQKPKSVEFADVAMSFLDKAGYGVQMYEEGAPVCKTASFALVLGGDGINFGHLGYLSGISSEAPIDGLKRLVSGEYEIERRLMLNAQVIRGDKVIVDSICLNEASIHRSTLLHALSLDVMINTKHTETIVGDGVIVATPTGSTSYNLSAGGPVLTPTSSSIVITPVCAKYFPQSSIVTDGADETEICVSYETINEQGAPCLVLDGDERVTLENGDLVKIKRAEHDAKIIKITDKSFYQILKEKLSK